MGQLICQKASRLQRIHFEGMFGKKKAFEQAMHGLNAMECASHLQEFTCKQPDLADAQILMIAQSLSQNYPALSKLEVEGEKEI